ncbi:MAG: thioredoxin domain-containing protein [Erythrobacter sp.]|uniref:thioredoxin domain-containing protein n=1 Tax=Erythrobacter sp. TaxID=1042 RepID=UPI00261BCFC2|nr:thioredoxin domain-containing protein [Erythrobacter sp.]MDJ0978830.1 thioredoxin domain-containing protein [Erythrobacter sp.]
MRAFRTLSALRVACGAFVGLSALALGLGSAAPGGAQSLANPQSDFVDLPPQAWLSVVERTSHGYRIGKPEAEGQLIEFISYTCSHCADFAKQSDGTLDVAAIGPGYLSVEVRPVIRNYLDLVVTMLVQCGDPAGFKDRHRTFLYTQDEWLDKAIKAPQSQKAIWSRGTAEGRINAAKALGFEQTLVAKGVTMPQINTCLRDERAAQEILANDKDDRAKFEITSTPTFAFNGEKLDEVHDWPALSATLQARFRPDPQESVTGG